MSALYEGMTPLASGGDVVQLAQEAMGGLAPWENALLGISVVMTALISIWFATSIVGTYFSKAEKSPKKATTPGKTEAAAQAPAASAAPAAAAEEIPLVAIIAAASYVLGAQVRNVIVHAPGKESVSWTSHGRQSIYASHAAKAPKPVGTLGTLKK
ncbi:MAG: OadG family protein [Rhodospirillaceae bacterium]